MSKGRYRLSYPLPLLFSLCLCLLNPEPGIAVVEPYQHAALRDVTTNVKIDLDDLSADRCGNIGLGVTGKVTRRLEVCWYLTHDCLRCCDVDDDRLFVM